MTSDFETGRLVCRLRSQWIEWQVVYECQTYKTKHEYKLDNNAMWKLLFFNLKSRRKTMMKSNCFLSNKYGIVLNIWTCFELFPLITCPDIFNVSRITRIIYHKWSLESGESNAISFVYWECDNRMLYEKMRKRYN